MTPQQKDLILNALRHGEENTDILQKRYLYLNAFDFNGDKIRAAIKELEAMPTEEVK